MALLTLNKLKIAFKNTVVIKDASFELKPKDFVCVVGANGSGKTTLVKGILGLIKPCSGSVDFEKGFTKKDIGYLPQENNHENIFPALVSEVVLSGTLSKLGLKICYPKSYYEKMCKVLKELGILELENTSFSELSGGQKQRVLLARALVSEPKLLILDEPSNNLDDASKKNFYELLKKINQNGMTILMITHDLDAADLIGNKILAIENGLTTLHSTNQYLRRFR